MKGFEIKQKAPEEAVPVESVDAEVVAKDTQPLSKGDRIVNAMTENFSEILNIASEIVSIKKMRVDAKIYQAKIDSNIKLLKAKTDKYLAEYHAETERRMQEMNKYQLMLKDFYLYNNGQLRSDDFAKIMEQVIKNKHE